MERRYETATFTIEGYSGGVLPDGNYRGTLSRYDVTNTSGEELADDAWIDFFVLAGDANRSRDS